MFEHTNPRLMPQDSDFQSIIPDEDVTVIEVEEDIDDSEMELPMD